MDIHKVFIIIPERSHTNRELYYATSNGWWSKILAADFDKDGDVDFILGNLGINAQIKADSLSPAQLYYTDIDKNGSIDPILTFFIDGVSYPSPYLDDLISQVPSLRKKFLYYKDYAAATMIVLCRTIP